MGLAGASGGAAVIAVAGRRIDEEGSPDERFPLAAVRRVASNLEALFHSEGIGTLVCSAACGADLLAVQAALQRGAALRLVLPFGVDDFRASSVIDRPGDWGGLYDRAVDAAARQGGLLVLNGAVGEEAAYAAATRRIVEEAARIAGADTAIAVRVWEGRPRANGDATADFAAAADQAGMRVATVWTCARS